MKILHLDIETAPNKVYCWGLWDQNISLNQIVEPGYTMCWAAKWHGKRGVMFDSIHKSSMKKMLKGMWKLLNEADAVVHYNGKKFDIPTLNKEFILHDMPPPAPYHQIDLLSVARGRFKFPSNKLDYVAQALGIGAKVVNIGMELWVKCMDGDDKAWQDMEKYNKQDVRLLEPVYLKLLPWIKNHPNHALYTEKEIEVCPNCASTNIKKNGIEHTLAVTYQRYRCSDCGTPLRGKTNLVTKEKRKLMLSQSKL